eukprot:scaffold11969_cov16-Tisochrysis_lutea.AAC.2
MQWLPVASTLQQCRSWQTWGPPGPHLSEQGWMQVGLDDAEEGVQAHNWWHLRMLCAPGGVWGMGAAAE